MSSKNICLEASGAQVVFSTSFDPQHPPEAVIDGYVRAVAFKHSSATTTKKGEYVLDDNRPVPTGARHFVRCGGEDKLGEHADGQCQQDCAAEVGKLEADGLEGFCLGRFAVL